MQPLQTLVVYLQDQLVGHLSQMPGDRMVFHLSESYLAQVKPPVISQSLYDKASQLIPNLRPSQTKAPPFFSNLLPEGPLRQYFSQQIGNKNSRDFLLLKQLGQDLPGAIRLLPLENDHIDYLESQNHQSKAETNINLKPLKFSLAGIQLKFSALYQKQGGLTIPAQGIGGDWIIKLPSMHFQGVPENEFSMLQLAKAVGIEVPDIKLISAQDIEGLPEIAEQLQGYALAIKRFDRVGPKRIHTEDFAQVYNVYPNKKYHGVSYGNIAQMIFHLAGQTGLSDFIRRLIFNVLIGNGDMHLKNWSWLYLDKYAPQLAPAYDYVATHLFIPDKTLALSFAGSKSMQEFTIDRVKYFIDKTRLPAAPIIKITQQTVEHCVENWHKYKPGLPLPEKHKLLMEQHMMQIAKQLLDKP